MKLKGYNCTLEALEAGSQDGDLVILIHGFPDSPSNWQDVINQLAKEGFRVVAPWIRGYFPSELAPPYNIGALGLDIIKIAENYSANNQTILVGHDFGAMGTYCAANLRPDLFSKVVTMSVPPFGAIFEGFLTPQQLKKSWYIFFNQTYIADIVVPMNDFNFIDELWKDWGPKSLSDYSVYSTEAKKCFKTPENVQAALAYYRNLFNQTDQQDPEVQKALNAYQIPVSLPCLYLHGENDGCIGKEVGDIAIKYMNESSRYKVVKNAGHFLYADNQPDTLNEILEWIKS